MLIDHFEISLSIQGVQKNGRHYACRLQSQSLQIKESQTRFETYLKV